MLVIQCDSTLISDLADVTKRTELLKNPWAFLEQYGACSEKPHASTLINRLPGLTDAHQSTHYTYTNESNRTTGTGRKTLDPHWQ
jgi:hypothetical protein